MQKFFYLVLSFFILGSGLSAQTIRYVRATATGAGNGTSWQDASRDLQAMINESDENNGDMIFVAAGTYRPRTASFPTPFSRENSFKIQKNIKIFGGFPADGGDFSQRDWNQHKTILSGDLYQNDHHGAEFNDDNSYHVLVTDGSSVNSDCVIDGFIITGGNADHPSADYYQGGGGWYNGTSSPIVRNLIITENNAQVGGGWHNVSGSPAVGNIEIRNNRAMMGGGWSSREGNPIIKDVRIWGNHAQINGGGIYIAYISGLVLENVSIRGNTAERGGAVYQFDGSSTFWSSEITGNVAQHGAGVYSVTANVNIVNCTIAGNAAEYDIVWVSNASVNISNSILFNNASPNTLNPVNKFFFESSLVENQSYEDGLGNLSGFLNPAFVYPVMAEYSSDPGFSKATSQGDFKLLPCSPVINRGKNTALSPGWNTDLAGNSRIHNGTVDLGAFEYQSDGSPYSVVYVDSTAAPGGDGRSWQTALTSLAQAVQMSNSCAGVEKILVAKGTYFPEWKVTNRRDDRDKAFAFTAKKVEVLGGYPSGGGADRNWATNKTILSGDIDGNGILDNGNSFHVVVCSQQPFGSDVTLDGLIIEGGNANEVSMDLAPFWSSMIYNNQGGGGYSYNSFAKLRSVLIRNNFADEGGAWYHNLGGMRIYSSVISANQAANHGGGVYVNDGWLVPYNVTFFGNSAGYSGGGLYSKWQNQYMVNCILTGNSAGLNNPDYYGTYNEIQLQSIIGNRLFLYPGPAIDLGNESILNPNTLRLVAGSRAIDIGAGYDDFYDVHLDMGGNNRIINHYIDIGAFEYDPNQSLPVTLLDFGVVKAENQVLLTWNTTSEVNVSHFEIERSFDARSWGVVGVQNAKSRENGAAGIRNYSYKDLVAAVPVNFSGIVYYRLRMVDEDQTFSYSGIRSVLVESKGDDAVFRVYPNPTSSGLIKVDVSASQTAQLRIFDLMGREITATPTFEGSMTVDLSRVPKGIYMLHIQGSAVSTVKKVVVE